MASAKTRASLASDSIDLIDEDQAGRLLFPLFEQVSHPGCTDTDEHLHKIRSADGKEGNIGFPRDCSGKECFTRSRRSNQDHAFRDTSS